MKKEAERKLKKEAEKKVVNYLLKRFPDCFFLDDNRESPDFIIGNSSIKIGVEVTTYYPHRNSKGGIVN